MDLETLVRMALTLLDIEDGATTSEALREAAATVQRMSPATDVELIYRRLEELVDVQVDRSVALVTDHKPWLSDRRAEIEWRFWERYRHLLEHRKGFEPAVVNRLDEVTDQILDLTADPRSDEPWDRRGLVVGQVQSGKTANYLGVIAKAADAGFKVIIVLAGAHNDLRAQTQLRLDEGILGWDTHRDRERPGESSDTAHRIGVGQLASFSLYNINAKTTSAQNGDFSKTQAKVASPLGDAPTVLVIKKNKSVLTNVRDWLSALNSVPGLNGGLVIPGDHPLLIIDDEADHYSVNTARDSGKPDEETDPTAINKLIREILHRFEKSAYVGYTATAFANIFIRPDTQESEHGEDLFPRSFIVNLKPPTTYMGASRVFGLEFDDETVEALPVTRAVLDTEDWLPTGHRNGILPGPVLPQSLREAITAFVLSCAVRRARGQAEAHNSMLVHVTRFVGTQHAVKEQVAAELLRMRRNLTYGAGNGEDVLQELKELYLRDFLPTSRAMDGGGASVAEGPVLWGQVKKQLKDAVNRIEVREINGSAKDALDYFDKRETGLNVIAVGGDKLSRGLTLEGLSVSYYLRPAKAYDTLLQMGRWFGFRPGYEDLCRLYTTPELKGWYSDITVANAELLKDFDRMAAIKATPEDFGLRVRTHPDGLLVSAAGKVRAGQKVRLSFSGDISETVVFDRSLDIRQENMLSLEAFVSALDAPQRTSSGNLVAQGVAGKHIAGFLNRAHTSSEARRARTDLLAQYVENRMRVGELLEWSVMIASSSTKEATPYDLAGHAIGLTMRSGSFERAADSEEQGRARSDATHYRVQRLVSPPDERVGLSPDQLERALEKTIIQARADGKRGVPTEPSRTALRQVRSPLNGLLLIYPIHPRPEKGLDALDDERDLELPYLGLGVVFPYSNDSDASAEYLVTRTFQQLELGW